MNNTQDARNQSVVNVPKIDRHIQETNKESFSKKDAELNLDYAKTFAENKNILLNSSVKITVELGRSKIKIKDFLKLSQGSVLMLEKLSKEPLNLFVNDVLIACGEIVVSDNQYGLRITDIKKPLHLINMPV